VSDDDAAQLDQQVRAITAWQPSRLVAGALTISPGNLHTNGRN
jgi:hypothetical protein